MTTLTSRWPERSATHIPLDLAYARQLDAQDPLGSYRDRFVISDPDLIYLDGNSLGRLPKATQELVQRIIDYEWGDRLIRSWNEGWMHMPERIGAKLAEVVGARPDEVIIGDSTSVNLFKLVTAALQAQPSRRTIITDDLNFPSDLYILQGIASLLDRGHQIRVVPSADGIHGPVDELTATIDDDTAVVVLSHTVFKSGYVYDMAALTEAAHRQGALILWDLSHSVGSVPVELTAAQADLAIGCTYKYMNGGPGAPAFLYVRRDLQERLDNPITGWMSQTAPFDFGLDYRATTGMRRFLTGTPPLISQAAIEPGLDLLLEAGMHRIREHSMRQSEYLLHLAGERLRPLGFRLNSPTDVNRRGSHISLGHDEGHRIDLALINEMNVLPDFRRPDSIRLGIAPLYNTFAELHTAVERMHAIVDQRLYERYHPADNDVT